MHIECMHGPTENTSLSEQKIKKRDAIMFVEWKEVPEDRTY